jgi:hypothetical protein
MIVCYLLNEKPQIMALKLFLISLLGLNLIACRPAASLAFEPEEEPYVAETGYVVQGRFLHFYEAYGGEAGLGQPLSGETIAEGWQVQYFEKGRLEYHPENEPAYQITAGWLGELLQRRRPPIPTAEIPAANLSSHRYYPQTGHTLSGDFLDYFDRHGGTVRFGLPISEPFFLEGQLTQDFQSARFFWTPQAAEGVTLENIGQVYLAELQQK